MGVDVDSLRIAVVYVYPVTGEQIHIDFAKRFIESYQRFPAGIAHKLYVVCNGGPPRSEDRDLWRDINCEFFEHDDEGWDIGAYIHAAHEIPCDMMVCAGGHTYWAHDEWLLSMAAAFAKYGPGLYGASGSFERDPHIRTTTFWCDPRLLALYPHTVRTFDERYAFEAGPESITRLARAKRLPCLVVTPDGVYELRRSRAIPNTFRAGDQSNTLASDRYFDVWREADESERVDQALAADTLPKVSLKSRIRSLLRPSGVSRA